MQKCTTTYMESKKILHMIYSNLSIVVVVVASGGGGVVVVVDDGGGLVDFVLIFKM